MLLRSLTGLALSPDAAVALATVGICLGFVEFNRPGRILPGAVGLLLTLFGCAALLRHDLRPAALALLACSVFLLLANAWRHMATWILALATLAIIAGLRLLVPANHGSEVVHIPVAILCGGILGMLSGALTRIAYRARRSKALD